MFNFSPEFERIPILLPVGRNSPSEEPQNQPSFFHDEAHDASNTRAAELRRSEAGLGASGMGAVESSPVRRSPALARRARETPSSASPAPARPAPAGAGLGGTSRQQRARAAPPSVTSGARRVATQCKLGKGDGLAWLRRDGEGCFSLRLVGAGPRARKAGVGGARLAPR